ncbi:prenyltransferase/squalene oxidase repeat-containing protein [Actinoplanes sp. NPDC049118]|uniref:prenyltransferase/squalene oxidase repeat-containing protein n=1 Tax=Actinoplanes sp. NPDC049118 TaxID=3155769 RepID=UPI0033EA42B5
MPEEARLVHCARKLNGLLATIVDDTSSDFSISWYDTARVVALWSARPGGMPQALADNAVRALLNGQNADGSWGYPQAAVTYRLVPTLSAVRTLSLLGHRAAAERGIGFLAGQLVHFAPERQPDTVAVELIMPDLLEALVADGASPLAPALDMQRSWLARLHGLRRRLTGDARLPPPLWHSLEVLGPAAAARASLVKGAMTCSPAATAAALAWAPETSAEAEAFLTAEAARYAGGWPTVAPVQFFEGAWVVSAMVQSRVPLEPGRAGRARDWLTTALRPEGAVPGYGLPPDADDTACVLYALAYLGASPDPSLLDRYERPGHFATFTVERTPSISTNAHVLRTLRAYGDPVRARTARDYLMATQNDDGFWADKWHASPYYATSAATLALACDPGTADRVTRTVRWLLDSQREDGSWGVWHGTYEETAYALRALLAADAPDTATALRRGAAYLLAGCAADFPAEGRAPLWQGKELYEPRRIVLAFAYAALHACGSAGVLGDGRVPLPRQYERSRHA